MGLKHGHILSIGGLGRAAQVDAIVRKTVSIPQVPSQVVILDAGDSSDLTELSEAELKEEIQEGQLAEVKAVTVVKAAEVVWKGVPIPRHVPVTMLTTPHGVPCN